MSLLDVEALRMDYASDRGTVHAVAGMSFTVGGPGETLGVIGESGSGKSSLALTLMRLLPANARRIGGSVRLDGEDVYALSDERFRREVRWRRISMVFQGAMNALNPVIRVGRQVAERPIYDGTSDRAALAEAERLFELVGLPAGTARRYPHELSGGMKQRVAIAMALALRPDLVILDEPTSALDVSIQAQIMNLLKQLKRDLGLAMIFISHDIALASDIADRVAVVHGGQIREVGDADDVLTSPRDPYTQSLLRSVPRLHQATLPDAVPGTPPDTTAPLVGFSDVVVRFDVRRGVLRTVPVRAVDGVSLGIRRGEILAVVGESGSGKTTVGRASLGLVRPAAGRITFDDTELSDLRGDRLKAFRRRAQAIAQDPYASLSPYMTVGQIVEEPLVIHGAAAPERTRIVVNALEQAGLRPAGEFVKAFPHALSGGQRQRVAIARAIALEPDYLVADEPVSMIDASSRAEILGLLRRQQRRRNMAMLLITHDLAHARHIADRIAVMYRGQIVELGPSNTIIEAPHHPYTAALVAAVPEPDPANRHRMRAVIEGELTDPTTPLDGCPFHPRCPEFIAGTCDVRRPVLAEVQPGQPVACHLYPMSSGMSAAAPPSPRQRNE